MVEVIKVIDLTDVPLHMKEILYVRVSKLTREEITDIFQTAQVLILTWWTRMPIA